MRKLLRYLLGRRSIRDSLPRLKTSLKDQFDPRTLGDDDNLILLAGIVRDPHEAQKLMAKYDARHAADLLKVLPPPKRDTFRDRLARWIRLVEGSYTNDPWQREWNEAKRFYKRK